MRQIITAILLIFSCSLSAQQAMLKGVVTDASGKGLEMVNVVVKDVAGGETTDKNGKYSIKIPAGKTVSVVFSCIGFETHIEELIVAQNQTQKLDVVLNASAQDIEQVIVEDAQVRNSTLLRINPNVMNVLPDASGSIESLVKTMPGVASNNEMSSQYSVRGGSFDENLVYVNDIEIYRPILVRSGEQEGLSFVNSDMVSNLLFSAGGFDAKYGDKMASVLDIKYKRPVGWGVTASASLFGASITTQGDAFNHRLHHISGFRYKRNKYLLNSLETSGDYDPKFADFQTYVTYDLTERVEVGFLGNYSSNVYNFWPKDRTTKFGLYNQPMELRMYFEGGERDSYRTLMGAITTNVKVNDDFQLKFTASAFKTAERETYDILSEYYINEIETAVGASNFGDSVKTLGIGGFLEHGRNYLDAKVLSLEHKGMLTVENHFFNWGIKANRQIINDDLSEWVMIDSAGYSISSNNSGLYHTLRAMNNIESDRITAYAQDVYSFVVDSANVHITYGVRANYWNFNNELLISPRVSISYKPNWESDWLFKFSTGLYYQSPFYKEMRTLQGVVNKDIKAQKSIHFVLGADYNFSAWNRPFKFITELYYKMLRDLVSYQVDNLRTIYSGRNDADGYAFGLDMKVAGEFVKGVDSWLSLSLMKTEEDIKDDSFQRTFDDGTTQTIYPGYIPRPTDQRVNVSLFFQDYLPGNEAYKVHLQLNYGSRLPFGPPNSPRYMSTGRMPAYQRVDLGFSRTLKNKNRNYPAGHIMHYVKDAWIGAEVLNVTDRHNVAAYEWVSDYNGLQYAVPNSLTGRRFNVKLSVDF